MSEPLHIHSPFYSAGKQYHWSPRFKSPGLGVRYDLLYGPGLIRVRVGESSTIFELDKANARQLVERYRSYYNAQGIRLAVIPWEAFHKEGEVKQVDLGPQKRLWEVS